ncbi:MAG: four helix bundle protein [Fimbriimonadaceae bacterium]
MASYRDLEVWRRAKDLAVAVYRSTEAFPARERFGLAAQMRSAAVSIPSNIAEGYGRSHRSEYLQFLGIANGSLKELETQLIIAAETGLMSGTEVLLAECTKVGRQLSALIASLRRPKT